MTGIAILAVLRSHNSHRSAGPELAAYMQPMQASVFRGSDMAELRKLEQVAIPIRAGAALHVPPHGAWWEESRQRLGKNWNNCNETRYPPEQRGPHLRKAHCVHSRNSIAVSRSLMAHRSLSFASAVPYDHRFITFSQLSQYGNF